MCLLIYLPYNFFMGSQIGVQLKNKLSKWGQQTERAPPLTHSQIKNQERHWKNCEKLPVYLSSSLALHLPPDSWRELLLPTHPLINTVHGQVERECCVNIIRFPLMYCAAQIVGRVVDVPGLNDWTKSRPKCPHAESTYLL